MRLILWLLSPFLFALPMWLVSDAGSYNLAIEPLTIALILSALAAGGTAITAGQAPSGASFGDVDRSTFRRPTEGGALLDLLFGEAAFERGASGEAIAEDFLIRTVEQNTTPAVGRLLRQNIDTARSALLQGDEALAKQLVDNINRGLKFPGGRAGFPAPGEVRIENGQIAFTVNDPAINSLIESVGGGVSGQRTNIIRGILDLAATDPNVLARQQQDVINREVIERSNKLGVSPAPGIARAESEAGGLQRAAQLLAANIAPRQAALQAGSTDAALQALGIGAQTQSAGLGQAFQLANAIAQAESARNAGIANSLGSLAGIGILGGDLLSSNQLQSSLGSLPGPLQGLPTVGAGTPEDPFRIG